MQEPRTKRMFTDTSMDPDSSLFGSFFKRRRSSWSPAAFGAHAPPNLAISAQQQHKQQRQHPAAAPAMGLGQRLSLAASAHLPPSTLDPVPSAAPLREPRESGFSVLGVRSLGIHAPPKRDHTAELQRIKNVLLARFRAETAERERLLNSRLDEEDRQFRVAQEQKRVQQTASEAQEFKLSPDQQQLVRQHFVAARTAPNNVVVDVFKIELTQRDLATLAPRQWLNDNVIDMFLSDVTARYPNAFVFTTHFFSRLEEGGYKAVQRWAKRKQLNVFEKDYVFFPVNRGNMHWTMAVADNKHKRLAFYDSLPSGSGLAALQLLQSYLANEAQRLGLPPSVAEQYTLEPDADAPSQENGYDCGVFMCQAIAHIAAGRGLTYGQDQMPAIREQMAYTLLELGNVVPPREKARL